MSFFLLRSLSSRFGPFVLFALVAFGGGLFLGSRHAPSKITTTEHTVTDAKAKTTEEVKVAERTDEKVDRVVRTKRTSYRRDGTVSSVVERSSETVKDKKEAERTDATVDQTVATHSTTDRVTVKEFGPRARIDLLGGAVLQNPLTNGGLPFGALIVGAGASGRVGNSPIWVGGQIQLSGDKANPFKLTQDIRLLFTIGYEW